MGIVNERAAAGEVFSKGAIFALTFLYAPQGPHRGM
jgi:hypothetical protein